MCAFQSFAACNGKLLPFGRRKQPAVTTLFGTVIYYVRNQRCLGQSYSLLFSSWTTQKILDIIIGVWDKRILVLHNLVAAFCWSMYLANLNDDVWLANDSLENPSYCNCRKAIWMNAAGLSHRVKWDHDNLQVWVYVKWKQEGLTYFCLKHTIICLETLIFLQNLQVLTCDF